MTEIIIGILGGGAAVQLLNVLMTYRQNRRQMNATALGAEVEALERTITVLQANFERQTENYKKEVATLREEIETLRASRAMLESQVEQLGAEIKLLRRLPLASERQLSLDL